MEEELLAPFAANIAKEQITSICLIVQNAKGKNAHFTTRSIVAVELFTKLHFCIGISCFIAQQNPVLLFMCLLNIKYYLNNFSITYCTRANFVCNVPSH